MHGANINHRDEDGETALFHAVYSSLIITRLLLEYDEIDIHVTNNDGRNVLEDTLFHRKQTLEGNNEYLLPNLEALEEVSKALSASIEHRPKRKCKL